LVETEVFLFFLVSPLRSSNRWEEARRRTDSQWLARLVEDYIAELDHVPSSGVKGFPLELKLPG